MLRRLWRDLRSHAESTEEMRGQGRLAHKPEVECEPALWSRGTVGLFAGVIGDSTGSDSSVTLVSSPTLDVVVGWKKGQPAVCADCVGNTSSPDSVGFTVLGPVDGMSIAREGRADMTRGDDKSSGDSMIGAEGKKVARGALCAIATTVLSRGTFGLEVARCSVSGGRGSEWFMVDRMIAEVSCGGWYRRTRL